MPFISLKLIRYFIIFQKISRYGYYMVIKYLYLKISKARDTKNGTTHTIIELLIALSLEKLFRRISRRTYSS